MSDETNIDSMKSYKFDSSWQQPKNVSWGMGSVLHEAEGSTGQTSSSENWPSICEQILKNK